jgi:uncharacterized protein YcgL (UPF0745 family)
MVVSNKKLRLLLLGLIGLSILVSLSVGLRRYFFESKQKAVEIALPYHEVKKMALIGGISTDDMLEQLAEKGQITSIALEEETLEDFVKEGRVTILKGSEIINLHRVGHVNRFVLTHLYGRRKKPKPDHFYLIVEKSEDYERIRDFLRDEFGKKNVTVSRWNILEVVDEEEDLMDVGIGISQEKVKQLEALGFSVILRLKNSQRLNADLVKQKFRNLRKFKSVRSVVFEGKTVLGYPGELSLVNRKLQDLDFKLGLIEFTEQKGNKALAMSTPDDVIRVHSIPESEMEHIAVDKAVKRYVRAVKERGIKIVFLHPFFNQLNGKNIIDVNEKYFADVNSGLKKYGYVLTKESDQVEYGYRPAKNWEMFFLSLGVLSVCIYLLHYFIQIKTISVYIILGLYFAAFYICQFFGVLDAWAQTFAVLSALSFPSIAVISQFPSSQTKGSLFVKSYSAVYYILKLVGISLVGALIIATLLSDKTYLFGIQQYFGVKISFVVPLLLIGIFFYLRPHRIASIYYVFKRIFYAPIRTSSLIAFLFCLAFVFIYILRSGNYISFHIPLIEDKMRLFLEDLMFVRPRTKEFLIGYPFLMFAFLFVDRDFSRNWLWFYNVLGSVALISVVNSFCHLHTPLAVSLYRTLLGIGVGILVGALYVLGYKMIRLFFRRIT